MARQKSHMKATIRILVVISAIFFSLNIFIPMFASAQTTELEATPEVTGTITTIGQTISTSGGTLILACGLDSEVFEMEQLEINSPEPFFYSYYINPLKVYSDLLLCDGSGLTVQDTRYSGGFVLQTNATDYIAKENPAIKIDVTNLGLITQQANTSYSEDASGGSGYSENEGETLIPGSQASEAEIEYVLPFDLTFYGTSYTSIYLCSNGIINFSDGDEDLVNDTNEDCSPLKDTVFEDPGPSPHIMPYYKDLTMDATINPTFGIYRYNIDENTVKFRWKGAPAADTAELVEFEVIFHSDNEQDTITFNYADSIKLTDSNPGPLIGVTKGGLATTPVSATYTESINSRLSAGTSLISRQSVFHPGYDFTEIKKPGTPAAVATYAGNPEYPKDYIAFTDSDDDGISDAIELISGTVDAVDGYTPGRIGLYTVYPSFRLQVPNNTTNGTYENVITFTLFNSTLP